MVIKCGKITQICVALSLKSQVQPESSKTTNVAKGQWIWFILKYFLWGVAEFLQNQLILYKHNVEGQQTWG